MLLSILLILLALYKWVIILYCAFSFLYAFGVLDTRNRFVRDIGNFLARLTEPLLNPIRRILPRIGNVDLSPLILLLLLQYIAGPLVVSLYELVFSGPHFGNYAM